MNTKKAFPFKLVDNPFPLVIVDSTLTIQECSVETLAFFEIDDSAQPMHLKELIGESYKIFLESTENKKKQIETISIFSKTEKQRWIRTACYPDITNSHFHIYFDDVSDEISQYELSMRAKRIAKIGSWKVDLVKNTLIWSDITREIHEVPNDFVPDLKMAINFYKEGKHRDKINNAVSACMEMAKPFDLELIIVTAKGREKWVRAIGEAEVIQGEVCGFQGVFQDIDKIKREQLRYEILNNRMRAAIEGANIGIWDWDIEKNDLIWDENMFTIFGIDESQFKAAYEAWESVVHPDDKENAVEEVQMALDGIKEFDTEFRAIKGCGSIAYILGRAIVFRDEEGNPLRMVGINQDVTKARIKDIRARRLLEVMEKQNVKLTNFAHVVSHNIRSSSSNISMLSGMLLDNTSNDRTLEFIEMINKSAEKLEETISDLNEIVKIQTTDSLDLYQIEVRSVLESVIESINALVVESKAEIRIDIDRSLRVWGIKPYLTSIFLNLLTNSIKYRSPDRKLLVNIGVEHSDNQTVIAFNDNGIGIDLKKNGQHLFGMYKTFHSNKDAKGIGLYIANNQMEALDGRIEVKSSVGQGSTFYLHFKK
ncbi:MAG: PAS domain-containing protein [Allomuricauda sp.]|nr:MAG: PAS domain-containing protein [Allomuricauda sp.]